jgi:hypothetical protein
MLRPPSRTLSSPGPSELDESSYDKLEDVFPSDDEGHTVSLGPGSSRGDDDYNDETEEEREEDADGIVLRSPHMQQALVQSIPILSRSMTASISTDSEAGNDPSELAMRTLLDSELSSMTTTVTPPDPDEAAKPKQLGLVEWLSQHLLHLVPERWQSAVPDQRQWQGVTFVILLVVVALATSHTLTSLVPLANTNTPPSTLVVPSPPPSPPTALANRLSTQQTGLSLTTPSVSVTPQKKKKQQQQQAHPNTVQASNIGCDPRKLPFSGRKPLDSVLDSKPAKHGEKLFVYKDTGNVVSYAEGRVRKSANRLGPFVRVQPNKDLFFVKFLESSPLFRVSIVPRRPISAPWIVLVSKNATLLQHGHRPAASNSELTWSPASFPENEAHGLVNVTIVLSSEGLVQTTELDLGSPWMHPWRWTKALSTYTEPLKEELSALRDDLRQEMSHAQDGAVAVAGELHRVVTQLDKHSREYFGTAITTMSDRAVKAVAEYRLNKVRALSEYRFAHAQEVTRKTLAKAQARVQKLKSKLHASPAGCKKFKKQSKQRPAFLM